MSSAVKTATRQVSVAKPYGRSSRYYQVGEDAALLPSVTNILGVIGKPALINWAANTERALVIEAAAALWEDAPITTKMTRLAYIATLTDRIGKTKAHQKELAKAGEIGSQVHAKIEWQLRTEMGQTVGPEPVLMDKSLWAYMAYEDWRKGARLTPKAIEQVVWSGAYGYAGTMDLFAEVEIPPHGRCLAILDWKTGKGIYAEALLQNTAYVHAMVEMGHLDAPSHGVIVRFPKVETDPDFEVRVITPEEQMTLFPAFLAAKALWVWVEGQEQARKAVSA